MQLIAAAAGAEYLILDARYERVREGGIVAKLRYFFNDALRLAGVDAVTGKALTGHVTEEMRKHYSTVRLDEKRAAMEAVAASLRRVEPGPGPGPAQPGA